MLSEMPFFPDLLMKTNEASAPLTYFLPYYQYVFDCLAFHHRSVNRGQRPCGLCLLLCAQVPGLSLAEQRLGIFMNEQGSILCMSCYKYLRACPKVSFVPSCPCLTPDSPNPHSIWSPTENKFSTSFGRPLIVWKGTCSYNIPACSQDGDTTGVGGRKCS